ncbi:DNA mismatch repair protein MutS [candidate division KSB1 bacterium]|nr:DNA mismatch repair protein MutS [candidate division KSB1 bacterium]
MKEADNEKEDFPEFYIVTDVLDLHGFFPEQVPEIVDEFIKNARSLKLNRLRIIHGKGKSKLKYRARKALEKNKHVADFGDAPPEIGGWGATIVILKEGS